MPKNKLLTKAFTFQGKRYYVRAKTETDLAVKTAIRRKELEDGKQTVDGNTIMAVWGEKWLYTYKKNDVSSRWFADIKRIVNNIVLVEIGKMRIKDVRQSHLKTIINKYSGYSRSYQKQIKNIIHEMLEDAKKNRMILENPADSLTLPQAAEVQKRRSITDCEREHILKVCETHRGGLFLKIMLNCGLRPSEVARLQWKDVDLKEKELHVVGKTKTKASKRTVPIPELFACEIIKGEPFDLVCTNTIGGKLTRSATYQMWESFIYHLNISMGCETYRRSLVPPFRVADDLVMYNLRHTYCTDLEKADVPINIARVLMGHSSISVTAQIYTHADEKTIAKARDKINQYQGVAPAVAPSSVIVGE